MITLLKKNYQYGSLLVIAIIFLLSGCNLNTLNVNNQPSKEYMEENEALERPEMDLNTPTLEAEIHRLIRKENNSPAEVERIIKSLKEVNPATYENIEGALYEELYGWIYRLDMETKLKYISDILPLHDHVDGASAETYSAILYQVFNQSPMIFVQSLSELNIKDIESISSKLAYHAGYFDLEKIIADTKNTFSEKKLSKKEEQTVNEILKAFVKQK